MVIFRVATDTMTATIPASVSGFVRMHKVETDSTNVWAQQLISAGQAIDKLLLTTDFQTKGKGLDSNSWQSKPGENLLFSLVVKPVNCEPTGQFVITQAVSLGILHAIAAFLPEADLKIKWPNDIYVGNQKLCGMLIANAIIGQTMAWTTIGIGLNVNQLHFEAHLPNPISMAAFSGKQFDREKVLQSIVNEIDSRLQQAWQPPMRALLGKHYLSGLYRYMEWSSYRYGEKQITARIVGLAPFGQLRLETTENELLVCDLKEITFL